MTRCIVITRDRATFTRACIAALEVQSDLELHIVDHGSTWPPMLDYLTASPHPVHRLGDHPPRALWEWDGLLGVVGRNQPYLVTDPDLLLDCPSDWLDALYFELTAVDNRVKVGLGLRLDDLPSTVLATKVRAWESQYWVTRASPSTQPGVWAAPIDTTLALYRPLGEQPRFELGPAVRLDAPYLVRHLPWYEDPAPEETVYYRAHLVPGSSHWANGGW